jgi:PPOX class probable F420-dependent enzyme
MEIFGPAPAAATGGGRHPLHPTHSVAERVRSGVCVRSAMAFDPAALPPAAAAFLAERHLAVLAVARRDGSIHQAPVGVTWDADARLARVITWAAARKVALVRAAGRASVGQVDGARWITLEGPATVVDDPGRVAEAVARYAQRYGPPGARDDRVAIEIQVERVLGGRRLA